MEVFHNLCMVYDFLFFFTLRLILVFLLPFKLVFNTNLYIKVLITFFVILALISSGQWLGAFLIRRSLDRTKASFASSVNIPPHTHTYTNKVLMIIFHLYFIVVQCTLNLYCNFTNSIDFSIFVPLLIQILS